MSDTDVVIERRGRSGVIRLTRAKALNALNLPMVRTITAGLDRFEHETGVATIVIEGEGRAFCAGGDIRAMHDLGKAGDHAAQLAFWAEEYCLNERIARCTKPYVSIIEGLVMGGGMGLSSHGRYIVASDGYQFAMPEVGIGFFPDVGATVVLPRLPGSMGTYLALTGARIGPGDACALGLAHAFVPSAAMRTLRDRLADGVTVEAAVLDLEEVPDEAPVSAQRAIIDACFSAADLPGVFGRLSGRDELFASECLVTMRTKSPTSLALTLAQMRAGATLDLAAALKLEFRIVSRVCRAEEFYEGVRAVLIDKDQRPRWSPALVEDLDPGLAARYMAPLPQGDLVLPSDAR